MRAVVYDRYGPPEVLRVEDVERPVPAADEVLVQVHATTVNRLDCHTREANRPAGLAVSLISRLVFGLRRPRRRILGTEFAGVVEAVGRRERRDLRLDIRRRREALVRALQGVAQSWRLLPSNGRSPQPLPGALDGLRQGQAGEYRPVIDRTYPMDQVIEAARYVDTGKKVGSVVLAIR
jgi:NADPH:quinone reductase-like Zn-dependent oxidoreductase